MYFTYLNFFIVSRHFPCPIVFVSHFARFSCFSPYHILPCEFLIFLVCHFSPHIPGPTIWVSHFPCWWVLLPYHRSYSRHVSFSRFSVFLKIFQVKECLFLISMFFTFLTKIQVLQCVSHTSSVSLFLSIFQVIQCLCLIFHIFQFSCHCTVRTVCISHI